MDSMRLDLCIAEKYSMSRNKARQLIEAGLVSVNEQSVVKPSFEIIGDEEIGLQEDKRIKWVSRSAGKLDGFLDQIAGKNKSMSILGAFCLDVGSSTGGFTQVLLERGAVHVDAVDVGTDQLHEKIRTDSRVMSYEQTDIRSFMNRDT